MTSSCTGVKFSFILDRKYFIRLFGFSLVPKRFWFYSLVNIMQEFNVFFFNLIFFFSLLFFSFTFFSHQFTPVCFISFIFINFLHTFHHLIPAISRVPFSTNVPRFGRRPLMDSSTDVSSAFPSALLFSLL